MKYRDTENGAIYTADELRAMWEELARDGETDAETFADYIKNCTDKNGFLERMEA